jgi:hypothetical protein
MEGRPEPAAPAGAAQLSTTANVNSICPHTTVTTQILHALHAGSERWVTHAVFPGSHQQTHPQPH